MGNESTDVSRDGLPIEGAVASPRRGHAAPSPSKVLPEAAQASQVDPVALVLVDVGLPHLDRPFEYFVPASMADLAAPGARVKVRFAGQDVDGYVLARAAGAQHDGKLAPLR